MNKKLVYLSIAIIAFCVLGVLWIKAGADSKPEEKIASAANNIATAAGQAKLTRQPQKQPQSSQPAAAPQQPNQQPAAPAAQQTPTAQPAQENKAANDDTTQKASDMPPEELAKIREDLKRTVETKFNTDLGFPMDESKMIAYAQASLRVKKINEKWDIQISATESDTIAIEYNNQAVEEITKSLQNMQGLTIEQYNAMTKLTATNPEFNTVYQVYKELIEQGVIKPAAAPVAASTPVVTAPVVAPAVVSTPAAVPVSPGTAQGTQGLPAPRYSQQPSR